jgi:flagellar biosynthesis/type III secretory pathway chaperone
MNELDRNLILGCLRELSDRNIQEELWMGKVPSQQSSFVEAVEGLFTDSGLSDKLEAGQTGFSARAESALRELEQQLLRVCTRCGPANLINDAAMPKIRCLAAEVLELLKTEQAE